MGSPAGPTKLSRYHLLESISSRTFTPREYQVELLDSAIKKNTIICLGTGVGKTFIAVMLIKELAYQTESSTKDVRKKTIFLVPTGPLVHQQAKVVEDYTDLSVGRLYGDGNDSFDRWKCIIENNCVIISTPDIFRMILFHAYLSLSEINLLIFDECHRAVRNHSYSQIMQCFDNCPVEHQPRILGLSASLINSKCQPAKLEQEIRNLEQTLKCSVETSSELTMLCKYGSKPQEYLIKYDDVCNSSPDVLKILAMINSALEFLEDNAGHLQSDESMHPYLKPSSYLYELCNVVINLGPWCAMQAILLFLHEIYAMLDVEISLVHRTYLVLLSTVLNQVYMICDNILQDKTVTEKFFAYTPSKLEELLNLLKLYKPKSSSSETCNMPPVQVNATCDNVNLVASESCVPAALGKEFSKLALNGPKCPKWKKKPHIDYQRHEDTKSLCGVLFVKQRITAYLLNLWLTEISKHHEDFKFLSTNFIIGHCRTSDRRNCLSLESQKQEEVLRKFKSREHNLLVTTSVVEEGLDIPKCNLVIRFDVPENFRSYVQSKGRARASESMFVILIGSKECDKFVKDLCDFKIIEVMLLQRSHRMDLMDEDLSHEQDADNLIEPYIPKEGADSPRVTLSSAISLVNRYCAKLPSDTFTRLTPNWKVKDVSFDDSCPLFECTIKLPINSPLKQPIVGQSMRSKHLAKMAAALKTCKELHLIGELDDNLLPTGKEAVKFEDDVTDECINFEHTPMAPRPGTTKRRQYYFKQVADTFKNGVPKPSVPCFLYFFRMVLTCPIPEEQNTRGRKIHDPADSPRSFGMVMNNALPKICSFPVFTRSGEVLVSIERVTSSLELTEEEFELLAYFHNYTFSDVLRLEKYPMTYCPAQADFGCFVVPVNRSTELESYSIDWDFVHHINKQKGVKPRKLTVNDRHNFQFLDEDYEDAVVMPWYRNLDKPQFFYVAEICSNLSPMSSFPDEYYETFKGYYEDKYRIFIMNTTQPLLDVDHTSARLNLLTPRYVNRKGVTLPTSSENTKKTKREDLEQKQILIPELCIIHPFPASLWRKAVCLPCILYRTNSLLLAEQLRAAVAEEISVGIRVLSDSFTWPFLDFGWTLADVIKSQADDKEKEPVKKLKCKEKKLKKGSFDRDGLDTNLKLNCDTSSAADYQNFDFEIDVFDPDKCSIPDYDSFSFYPPVDDDESDDFGTIDLLSWFPPLKDEADEPVVRYGSPSNFEIAGWDFESDNETKNANFCSVNDSGLEYISVPGIINMQSFSMDLASSKDMYESWDEESQVDSSETATNDFAAVINPKAINIDVLENDFSESKWLPLYLDSTTKQPCDLQDPTILDNSVIETVDTISRTKMREIKFLKSDPPLSNCNVFSELTIPFPQSEIKSSYESIYVNESKLEEKIDTSCLKNDVYGNIKGSEKEILNSSHDPTLAFGELLPNREEHNENTCDNFTVSFDDSPDLCKHSGPSPSIILQAFTMSNANDGINLERLETVGDSFLKYAITVHLFCVYPNIHEGKLSFLRSKQISNLNLYRLGKMKCLGELMVATKFEPNDNWLPPCYVIPKGLEQALIESGLPVNQWNISNFNNLTNMSEKEIFQSLMEKKDCSDIAEKLGPDALPLVPYNLLTQHSIPDKSIADCVEALIGAYLVSCGSRGALLFMSWLGLKVLPQIEESKKRYGYLEPPPSPLLTHVPNADQKLSKLLFGYSSFEEKIGYSFKDKTYLLQAFTHASYYYNTLTDCYQRLEFLGDAVLDYLITRHLYEDPKKHSPGTLTDLRSALVNNTFFASLAVKYDFHKYFKAISPSLFHVINKFVELKEHSTFEDYSQSYYLEEDECEEVEEVEVPKALGDIFESVAGALYLDSGMSLDTVWKVYYSMMKPEIDYFSTNVPKSPIRELLELEPQTAKFEKSEMTLNGKVRVRVEVFGKGSYVGIGRNKRIAKCTAAKRALRELKKLQKANEMDEVCLDV